MSDHAAAKAMYQDYLARAAVLERHRRYAADVEKATSGSGETPVQPLATMGKNGGPLLCDVCSKPMILEGGAFQGVYADEAWRRNPKKGWASWISGGMVVRFETNRTVRIYHGYPGRSGCVQKADKAEERDRAEFRERSKAADVSAKLELLRAYFKAELPEKNNDAVLSDIYAVLFVYDPGLGINSLE
ncbi:MAG: hypothetical protein M4D80_24550 [Myxococcota bacterium]|nr:hypothetical protein [Myxococcota bacterium]